MEKDVLVTVTGVTSENMDMPLVLTTVGKYTDTPKGYKVTYPETLLSDEANVVTEMEIERDGVSMFRSGSDYSYLYFREGHQFCALNKDEPNTNVVTIYTNKLMKSFGDAGGHLDVYYTVHDVSPKVYSSFLHVEVREQNSGLRTKIYQ